MTTRAIKIIRDCLPHYAEEGNQCSCTLIEQITQHVVVGARIPVEAANASIMLVQRLFDSLALLDRPQLREGRWQFVSFPAQLLANSLISVLADENQDLLDASYWEQGAHRPEDVVDEQRALLRALETGRLRSHRLQSAEPIRFVYVAWGLIRLGGRFLLHHREDKIRRHVGNYVLPGGRLNLMDLTAEFQSASALPLIQRAGSPEALACLTRTLIREMLEETGLRHHEHYDFHLWRRLKPYREVEGSRNNHAYTEYLVHVFEVVLTDSGQVGLFDQLCAHPERFAWFSSDDLIRKATVDGKVAYIDALHADLGDNLRGTLCDVQEAFVDSLLFREETDALDIPFLSEIPLLRGRTGKERQVSLTFDDQDSAALWGLAWHMKQLDFASVKDARLLPLGWVKILDERLARRVRSMATRLKSAGLALIESRDQVYFRLSALPAVIFFDGGCFRYSCGMAKADTESDCWFRLCLEPKDTPLGRTAGVDCKFAITRNTQRIIKCIESGQDPEGDSKIKSGDLQKLIREQIDARTKPLGLRKFVRLDDKAYFIAPDRM